MIIVMKKDRSRESGGFPADSDADLRQQAIALADAAWIMSGFEVDPDPMVKAPESARRTGVTGTGKSTNRRDGPALRPDRHPPEIPDEACVTTCPQQRTPEISTMSKSAKLTGEALARQLYPSHYPEPDPPPKKKSNGVVEYAQHHGHLSQAPIFTIARKGPDNRQRDNKIICQGRGENPYKIEVWMVDPLNYDDASVFGVLLATGAPKDRHTAYGIEHELRKLLAMDGHPEICPNDSPALGIESNFREILIKLGWDDSGKSYARLEESFKRLGAVRIYYHFNKTLWSGGLMGFRINTGSHAKSFTATINPVSSMVILGDRSAGCVMSGLHELRALSGQIELALYFDLIRLIKPGTQTSLRLENILRRIYRKPTADNRQKFLNAIRSAHEKLAAVSKWKLEVIGRGRDAKIHVTRPALQRLNRPA